MAAYVRSREESTKPVTKRVQRHGLSEHGHACKHEHNAHGHNHHDNSHSHHHDNSHGHCHSQQRSVIQRLGKTNSQSSQKLSNFPVIGRSNRDGLLDNSQSQQNQSQSLLAGYHEHDPSSEWHWPSLETRGSTVRETQDNGNGYAQRILDIGCSRKNNYGYLAGGISGTQCLPHETALW